MEQDRRTFMKSAALAAGYVGLSSLSARSFAAVQGANDRVRVAVVGFSDRFRGALCRFKILTGPRLLCAMAEASACWTFLMRLRVTWLPAGSIPA